MVQVVKRKLSILIVSRRGSDVGDILDTQHDYGTYLYLPTFKSDLVVDD